MIKNDDIIQFPLSDEDKAKLSEVFTPRRVDRFWRDLSLVYAESQKCQLQSDKNDLMLQNCNRVVN